MSVKIDGIGKLRTNYYDKLMISEEQEYNLYRVVVSGKKNNYETDTIGDRFGQDFSKLTDEEKIRSIIDDYIKNAKICSVSDLVEVSGYNGKMFNVIYGNFGYRQMLLRLFNSNLYDVMKKVQGKYFQDRFDFCYEEKGIRTFKITTSNVASMYNIDLDKIHSCAKDGEYFKHICLKEEYFRVIDSERKFIGDFIINNFSKFGEEIQVEKIYNTEYPFTSNDVLGYMLKCGDVKIYVPKYEPLLFILVIVGNYNLQLKFSKEEGLKRQLKMEGF